MEFRTVKKAAQQGMHLTLGILRTSQAVSYASASNASRWADETKRGYQKIMQVVRIILFSIIGLFLGIFYSNIITSGYFEQWKISLLPPDYLITRLSEAEKQVTPFITITKPCDYSEPEFSFFSNSPKDIEDCLQIRTHYPEGYGQETFVRDSNGNIWEWSYLAYFGLNELVCYPSYGLLIGLVVAIATKELTKIQKELEQKQKELEQKQKASLE